MGDTAARVGPPGAASAALDRFFETFYRRRPVAATYTGIHEHDGRLPDWSRDGLERDAAEMRALRRELDLAGRVPDADITEFPAQVDLALADGVLEIAQAEHDSQHFVHANPSLWTGEAIFGVLSLVTRDFAPLADRLASARRRLQAIPAFLADLPHQLVAAPLHAKGRAKRECQAAAALFSQTLPAWVARLAAEGTARLSDADVVAWSAASMQAAKAFADLEAWLAVGAPGHDGPSMRAVYAHECAGSDLLGLMLSRAHFVTTPVPDLLAEATDALDEAAARLETMARPHGGWAAVQEKLAADHPSAERYYATFHDKWQACWKAAQDYKLVTWPIAPLRYGPVPEHVREAAPSLYYLNYRSPAPFDPYGLFDYVVPPIEGLEGEALDARLRAVNHSVITLNHVVHHGAIGHHVQNHHAYKGRSRIGKVAAVDTANRIAMGSGGSLAEGWACYVCDLMEEIGFLSPLERIAQQHTRVRIAARAVVDLSLHSGRLTVPKATLLYEDRALMSGAAAQTEAVRNSMYPGTAVMYWLGTRGLHKLRADLWAKHGGAFSMRAFHDGVLKHGAIPVALIARLMLAEKASA